MVSFENFVKSLPPSLSELKVKPIFCFPIKIRDDPTASTIYAPCKIRKAHYCGPFRRERGVKIDSNLNVHEVGGT